MLNISFTETPSEEKWILQGRLTAPWLRELKACWKKKHRRDNRRACIVDLNEIAFIDKSGERLLRHLLKEGAQCIASADYTKHVLEKLTTKGKGSVYDRLAGLFFAAAVGVLALLIGGTSANAQNATVTGGVPSDPTSDQVLQLTLRHSINLAVRYKLGAIESGENAQVHAPAVADIY